jgi:glyoxylase-like metal-dependent hydrolase (beta-lactamase superfamily II)
MPDGIHQFAIGNVAAWVISDGSLAVDGGSVFGSTPRRLWQQQTGLPDDDFRIPLALNCLLLRSDGALILVDTGLGPLEEDEPAPFDGESRGGRLMWALAALGIPPADIDVVVNTHLHRDHVGWNARRSDRGMVPVFPKATYYVQRSEWDFWIHPQQLGENPYLRRLALPIEAAGRLKLARGEVALTDEVRLIPTPGHTRGHQSVLIRSGREVGVYLGDLSHHPSMLEKEWISGFDLHPVDSRLTQRSLRDQALRESAVLIGPHFAHPGVGRLVPDGREIRWIEEADERSVPNGKPVRRLRFLPG